MAVFISTTERTISFAITSSRSEGISSSSERRAEEHLSFTFEHNIVYWKEGKLLAGNFSGSNFRMDNNIYWKEGGDSIRFDTLTFPQWREPRVGYSFDH